MGAPLDRDALVRAASAQASRPAVAIVLWGLLLEDVLAPYGVTLEEFCAEFTGSWVFGYADALQTAGVATTIVCVSEGVDAVTRRRHRPTGAEICLLPVPRLYALLRRRMDAPYGRTVAATFGGPRALRLALLPLLFAAKELAPYLSTPVRTLRRELERRGCWTLLCQEYEFPRFDICVALGKWTRIAVFATFQGGDYQRWHLERIVRPLAIRAAAGLVIASQAETERVCSRYRPRAVAGVPNPINLETWRPHDRASARAELAIAGGAQVAAWHGRIELQKKGLDTLLDAWARVSASCQEAVLLLIGGGSDAEAVRRRIGLLRLGNVVWVDRFLHDRSQVARLLAASDVYAFTSRHEGFPLAPLEAMACGLPVVAADAGGIRDLLPGGEADGGVIVPRNDPERTAAEIVRLFEDGALRRRLGAAARRRAEAFGLEPIGRQLRSFLLSETS